MQTIPLEEAQGHLAEIIEKLPPGGEIIITRGDKPVAKLSSPPGEQPRPMPGGPLYRWTSRRVNTASKQSPVPITNVGLGSGMAVTTTLPWSDVSTGFFQSRIFETTSIWFD